MKTNFKVLVLSAFLLSFRQNSSDLKFSMASPDKWSVTSNSEIYDNVNNFKLSQAQLDKYVSDHKGSVLFLSYSKYDASTHRGLIPTIQVNIRNNSAKTFDDFFQVMKRSSESFANYFQDFEYIDKPQKVKVGGKDAFYFSSKFTMTTSSRTIKPRSRTYAIPNGRVFFQVNFTDGDGEDCSSLFDSLIKTIKLE